MTKNRWITIKEKAYLLSITILCMYVIFVVVHLVSPWLVTANEQYIRKITVTAISTVCLSVIILDIIYLAVILTIKELNMNFKTNIGKILVDESKSLDMESHSLSVNYTKCLTILLIACYFYR